MILGTGIVYGLSARPLARALRVVEPKADRRRGHRRCRVARGLRAVACTRSAFPYCGCRPARPGLALAEAEADGVATISLLDGIERVDHAIEDAKLSRRSSGRRATSKSHSSARDSSSSSAAGTCTTVVDPPPSGHRPWLGDARWRRRRSPLECTGPTWTRSSRRGRPSPSSPSTARGCRALVLAAVRPDGSVNLAPAAATSARTTSSSPWSEGRCGSPARSRVANTSVSELLCDRWIATPPP